MRGVVEASRGRARKNELRRQDRLELLQPFEDGLALRELRVPLEQRGEPFDDGAGELHVFLGLGLVAYGVFRGRGAR